MTEIWTVDDALDMLWVSSVNLAAEMTNARSAYRDLCKEIAELGGAPDFSFDDFAATLRADNSADA